MQTQNLLKPVIGGILMLFSTVSSAWLIDDNYDAAGLLGVRCVPFFVVNADTFISNENSSSGSNSCRMAIQKGGTGWGGGFVLPSFLAEGDSLWVRFRLFVPVGFNYFVPNSAGAHLKFIRITLRDPNGTVGRLDWLWSNEGSNPFYLETLERDTCTTNCNYKFASPAESPARGVWETYEMYAKFDKTAQDDGGTGVVRMWKNGVLLGERTDRPTMWPNSTEIVSVLLFSFWNGGSPETQHLYMDDLIATNDTPTATDAAGNPFIGPGSFVYVAPPSPPNAVQVK